MIIQTAEFITSAVKPGQYPDQGLPEIAFAGRSNVGKSSLINTLVNRKNLVKTSRTPGRTQLINFFAINRAFLLVDLPGYGYARVPASVKKKWAPMIETYLATREALRAVVVILDVRRTPGQLEFDMINWLMHHHIPAILVLTKADKFKRGKQAAHRQLAAKALGKDPRDLILFSAKSRLGKDRVWEAILRCMPETDGIQIFRKPNEGGG